MTAWQKCPVCAGTGVVSRPPGVPADRPTFVSHEAGPWPCPTCQGARIIRFGSPPREAP